MGGANGPRRRAGGMHMKVLTSALNALQIRRGEERLVLLLGLLMFLPWLGGNIGSAGIDALFFNRFGVQFLPYMYVAVGLVVFAVSLGLTTLLGRVSGRQIYLWMPVAIAAYLLVARLLVARDYNWFYPVLWLVMRLQWTLQALFMWGLAGMACDTRQAKRLFPLFGAGGILGGAIGGIATQPLALAVGAENLLLAWLFTYLLAFWIGQKLKADLQPDDSRRSQRRRRLLDDLLGGFSYIRRSTLMSWLAVAALLFSLLYFALVFSFSKEAAAALPDEDQLAGFIGLFQGIGTAAAFLLSLVLANRIYARVGFMGALLGLGVIYAIGYGALSLAASFALIVGVRFVQVAWMEGIASPAYTAIFNVIPASRREQARLFMNGVPTQGGVALVGILLILAEQALQPAWIFAAAALIAGAALLALIRARRGYRSALADALRTGRRTIFFSDEEPFGGFRSDATAIQTAVDALADPSPGARRVAAEVLGSLPAAEVAPPLVEALDDEDPSVRVVVLNALGRAGAAGALLEVAAHLNDAEPEVRAEAVRTLGRLAEYPRGLINLLRPLLEDPEAVVRIAAADQFLKRGEAEPAKQVLWTLVEAPAAELRRAALEALTEAADPVCFNIALGRIEDPAPDVRRAALRALASVDPERAAMPLYEAMADPEYRTGETAARALAGVGGRAPRLLLTALEDPVRERAALAGLASLPPPLPADKLRAYAERKAEAALGHSDVRARLDEVMWSSDRIDLLRDALLIAARREARMALQALSILAPGSGISLALEHLDGRQAEGRANALEMLDSMEERSFIHPLLSIWEAAPSGPDASMVVAPPKALAALLPALLTDPDPWLRACTALAAAEADLDPLRNNLEEAAASDPDLGVREIAARVLQGATTLETQSTLTLMERVLFLRKVPLFAEMPPEELRQVATVATERFYTHGEYLVHKGERGDEMFLILTGRVRVLSGDGPRESTEIARRGEGEVVGEMAILSEEPRMASLLAEGDVQTLCLDQQSFEDILRERAETSLGIIRVLMARLRESQQEEANLPEG